MKIISKLYLAGKLRKFWNWSNSKHENCLTYKIEIFIDFELCFYCFLKIPPYQLLNDLNTKNRFPALKIQKIFKIGEFKEIELFKIFPEDKCDSVPCPTCS